VHSWTSDFDHICHSVRHSQLSQPVVSFGQSLLGDLDYTCTRTVTYGSRAFAVSGPTCWNLLPSSLKSPSLKPTHFLWTAKDNTHGTAVVTMLQDSHGDENCSLSLKLTFAITVTLTFDLLIPKSTRFTSVPKCTQLVNLIKFPQVVCVRRYACQSAYLTIFGLAVTLTFDR